MAVERYIAKRYIVARHRINFITIISYLSIAGISIGVGALLVVLSVFNGFGSLVTSYLMSFDPHLRIEAVSAEGLAQSAGLDSLLAANKQIASYAPFAKGKVLALQGDLNKIADVKGISEEEANSLYGIEDAIRLGSFSVGRKGGLPHAVIGIYLADRLHALTGDTITVVSPVGIERSIASYTLPPMQKLIIAGIYESRNNDYDASFIFTDLATASRILGYRGTFQGYDIILHDRDDAETVKQELASVLNVNNYQVQTWYDFHKQLYSVMQIERWAAYLILSLIIAVAAFNILASLTMSVIEKRRDIGILRAMGLSEKSIVKLFLNEGLIIGLIGTFSGFALGLLVYWLQVTFNLYPLNPLQYRIDSLPMELRLYDFLAVGGASMLLSLLASLYPAKRASKINPIEAIRWE